MMKKLLAAAVCGAFAASALAAMPEKVTIVYVKSPFNLQNMVMKEKGMLEKAFEKDGVKVEWKSINSGAKQAQAMAAGAVDVSAVMNTASLLMANGSGNPSTSPRASRTRRTPSPSWASPAPVSP
ncbi:MAG: ABC transporter substrate-binding protein [Sutterella wadsworthensis]